MWVALAAPLLCGAGACPRRSKPPALEGAITEIPVYSPATLVRRRVYPHDGPVCPLDTLIWDLETPDDWAKVEFFYRQKLSFVPPELGEGSTQGKTIFRYLPDGGETARREQIVVTVGTKEPNGGTKFQIDETVCAARRAESG